MIRMTIDGQTVEVAEGTTVLQASRAAGKHIPTLCDHPALKPYGGCRLCVVEVEGARTLQASCTLPAWEGMVVHTDTPKVRASRDFVLSLIFSERNHFCMYCQKTNGDCELQNAAYGEGMTHWDLQPNWKPFLVDASHPYFVFDHNRCILCRRCVRACGELVGSFTLALENRGASTMVVADSGLPMGESSCLRCGTCVQSCPTGALIDRRSAYVGKETDVDHVRSICVGCSLGCGVDLLVNDNHLVRVDGDWEAEINHGLLCETGRYRSLKEPGQRILSPMVKKNGSLEPATWEEALSVLAENVNGKPVAALASTRLPVEALHAFKSLFAQALNSRVVTSIEEGLTSSHQASFGTSGLEALKTADCVLVIGADLTRSHPVAGFFVRRNIPLGTRLILADPEENSLSEMAAYNLNLMAGSDTALIQGLMAAVARLGMDKVSLPDGFDPASVDLAAISQATGISSGTIAAVARELAAAIRPVIVYGKGLARGNSGEALKALGALAGMIEAAAVVNVMGRANSLASHLFGLDKSFDVDGQAAFLALGDDVPAPWLVDRLAEAPFVAVQASFTSPVTERANVVFPVAAWFEQEGHYLNVDGCLQTAQKAVNAPALVVSNLEALEKVAKALGASIDGQWQAALRASAPAGAVVA